MRQTRYSLIFASVCLAVSWLAAMPARAIAAGVAFLQTFADVRPLRELFAAPKMALVAPGHDQVSPSHWHRNRHEAGIAHLGSVRHT